jgi:hypothetical protein
MCRRSPDVERRRRASAPCRLSTAIRPSGGAPTMRGDKTSVARALLTARTVAFERAAACQTSRASKVDAMETVRA